MQVKNAGEIETKMFQFDILKKLYGPFFMDGFNCLEATEPLRESLLLTIQFPGVPGTQLIDFGRMKS